MGSYFTRGMVLAIAATAVTLCCDSLQSQTPFRIDTDIYEDVTKPPIASSLTLFSEGVCYDFDNTKTPQGPGTSNITIIDTGRQRIFLLNPKKKIKSELNMGEVERLLANVAQQMTTEQREAIALSKGVEKDPSSSDLIVRNKSLEYRCSLEKVESSDIASLYCQFADWSSRLNALYPPHLPPYLRLELNAAVAAENAIPKELQKTARNGSKERKWTSRVLSNWRLSKEDQTLIVRAGAMMVQFEDVSIETFLKEQS